jgi:oligopeptidase B
MKTPENKTGKRNWVDLIPHREDVLLEDIEIFKNYLVVEERSNGLNHIRIMPWNGEADYYLPFGSETYNAYTTTNIDFDTDVLRYSYQSLATPSSVIDFNMKTKTKEILKEQQVLGGKFDKENYIEERVWATARDGVKVPISMIYRKGLQKNGKNPLLLYAYGSYGITMDTYFSSTRLSLLDRGFVYAIAHVRGGSEMGRKWYYDGRQLKKKNTFLDFIAVAEGLHKKDISSPQHTYAEGGSAGGLLMGSINNMKPSLFNGILSDVPFVDLVTTMLDDSIPLTTSEYDEWGDPRKKKYYNYMKSYSPYDNVTAQNYPHHLVTTGFHDSQVQYWEPAKWVAKLRKMKTDQNTLLFVTDMESGHSGKSGRFEKLRKKALQQTFLLSLEKLNN